MLKSKKGYFGLQLILTVLLSILVSCKGNESKTAELTLKSLSGKNTPISQIESSIEKVMKKAGVSGLSCAVINDGEIVYAKGFGHRHKRQGTLNDKQTIFAGASLSKTIFAYLVMKLVEEGLFELDKPLYEYLVKPFTEYANYTDIKDDERYKDITAKIALSHQTGFPNRRFLMEDGKLRFLFDPGARYSYSGEGIELLQMVVEEITGQDLEEMANEKIFNPLGMDRTSYVWQEEFEGNFAFPHNEFEKPRLKSKSEEASAAGSLQTTAEDYARLLVDIIKAENISQGMVDEMLIPQVSITSERMFGPGTWRETDENKDINLSWCLGWGRFDSKHGRAFFHTGHQFGFQNYSVTYVDVGMGVVLLSNSDNFESVAEEIIKTIIGEDESPFEWLGYEPFDPSKVRIAPPDPTAIKVDPEILSDYTGEYEFQPGRIFSIKQEQGNLLISLEKDKWMPALAETETSFFIQDSDYKFSFNKDDKGQVTSMIFSLREIELECQKIK